MDENKTTIEEQFDGIPTEVQNYIYSRDFVDKFQKMCEGYNISEPNKNLLRGSIYGFLAQMNSEEDLVETINKITPEEGVRHKIILWIRENVTDAVFSLTEEAYLSTEEDEGIDQSSIEDAPSPADMLARLNQTLTKPTTLAPTKREYGSGTPVIREPISEVVPTSSVDPYRELPEK